MFLLESGFDFLILRFDPHKVFVIFHRNISNSVSGMSAILILQETSDNSTQMVRPTVSTELLEFRVQKGRNSSVGIETRYGLDDPVIESRWGEIFRTRPDRPWGPPSLLYNWYRISFPGVKRPGLGVDHPPYLAPRLKKE